LIRPSLSITTTDEGLNCSSARLMPSVSRF
jgi:hypothetical protein